MPESDNDTPLFGYCAPGFEKVRLAFLQNLTERNEVGACVSVVKDGKTIVDLWGGYTDELKTQRWEKDTLVCVMSVTKGIASLAVLSLADQGIIDLDKPVASYWPEFAQAGKEAITVRCLLAQLGAIPVADAAPAGSLYDEDIIVKALEVQKPLWPIGTTPCYHSFTHGPLCQHLVQVCTGKTLGQYLDEVLLAPLGIEFFLAMGDEQIARCADIIISEGVPTLTKVDDPGSLLNRAWKPMPTCDNLFMDHRFRTNEFASGNGHSNARNLAKLYGHLANVKANAPHNLLSKACVEDAIREQWDGVEVMTHRHFRYGTGFMLNNPYFKIGHNPRSFGHPGLGGANAFADPDEKIGFAYACNRVHPIDRTGPCAEALIDALYDSL
jgi:CubicO group peptidase (beta-lactamase class C family)